MLLCNVAQLYKGVANEHIDKQSIEAPKRDTSHVPSSVMSVVVAASIYTLLKNS